MDVDDRRRWLIWISLSEIGTMLVFSSYSALLPILQKEWALTNSQAGWIYSSYQIGYILSVVFLTSLTDYVNPRYIYVLTAFWSGISGILFSLWAEGFYSAWILRTLMGIGFAGTYMPGLRMVSEKFPSHKRGRAVGIYVGTFSLGVSLSLFLTGFIHSLLSWRWAFFITSLGPISGGAIAFFRLGEIRWARQEEIRKVPLREVLQNRPVLMMIGGYVAHMWELFGMRGWMVAFLTACLLTAQVDFSRAVSLSAAIAGVVTLVGAISNVLGGMVSDRFGRVNTVIVIMLGSGLLSFLIGWTRTFPFGLVLTLSILYGFLVTGESSVLSTGVTELAHPAGLGRTMALQSLLGWGAASLSPIAFGYILDITNPAGALDRLGYVPNWGWAFMSLGIGVLLGPLAVWRIKKWTGQPT
ncbi:MAG: MFS transporter [Syntrophaceae bacterium]|nr:MFS transporter [Syntrophaceae bacterium]